MNLPVRLLIVAVLFSAVVSPASTSARDTSTRRSIVVLKSKAAHDRVKKAVALSSEIEEIADLSGQQALVTELSDASKRDLARNPDVLRIDEDIELSADSIRTAPQTVPWGIDRIHAPAAWSADTGTGIDVAVIDTGVDLDHPDLLPNIGSGINIVKPKRAPDDDNGHGTHVAGIIGAASNAVGVVGVAPTVRIHPVKVLKSNGTGYLSDIIAGIDWAIANGMDVINLSLGAAQDIPSLHDAVQRADRAGIVVVAAAGNSGGPVMYPAAYPEVIAVGMIGQDGSVDRMSSRGPQLDLVAPGAAVYSTYRGKTYRTMTGTSMASPHVVGVAALLLARPAACDTDGDGRCSRDEVARRLERTATDLGSAGRDDASGFGLVNAQAALGF